MPIEMGNRSRVRTSRRSRSATSWGGPKSRVVPVRSRKAWPYPLGSMVGANTRRISCKSRDAREYSWGLGGTTMRSRQSRCAWRTGIPVTSPASRASGERARMVARSAATGAMARGRVRSAGATRPSSVAQKAGGSTNRTDRITDSSGESPAYRSMFTVTLLLVRPYRQLVAAGIAKVKPPSPGEAEDGADDGATSLLDPALLRLQIDGIDHDQRSASPDLGGSLEPATQPSIGKAGVFRS